MYDPARDIFTETQQPSPPLPPPQQTYQLSALDTLAGLAAEAEVVSIPAKVEESYEPVGTRPVEVKEEQKEELLAKENGISEEAEAPSSDVVNNVVNEHDSHSPDVGDEVAGTKGPELSLKVTLHFKRDKGKEGRKEKEMSVEGINETKIESEKPTETVENLQNDKMDIDGPAAEPDSTEHKDSKEQSSQSPVLSGEKTKDTNLRDEKVEPHYPQPLAFSKLGKIPKRKLEDRRDRPPLDRDQNRSRDGNRDGRISRRSRSPLSSYPSRSPPNRRLSDDRYRPPLIDSYRPSRDRDDHYSHPPKRPRSPSPPRQLKRPIRRDITSADRERERRERQLRDAERQKAELEAARNRPVYEAVRQHYNDRDNRSRDARKESPIFRLRKFNNWIKSVLIAKFIPDRTEEEVDENRGLLILDIGCGKGGDLGKWQKQPQVSGYVGVDIAEVSIIHAEQRAAEMRGRRFSTRFFAMDCFVDPIRSRLSPNHPLFDIVSMQFVMHYAFESEEKARTMLMNVSKNLRRGGYFIGTIPSSDAIIEAIKSLKEDEKEFGNSIYTIRFPERPTQTVFRPPYGHRYNFFMEDAVENVPEYIVPFEVFRGLAEDANLELVYQRTFHEMYEDEKDDENFGRLMDRMGVQDEDGNRGIKGEEWEAAGLYIAFAFEKRGGY